MIHKLLKKIFYSEFYNRLCLDIKPGDFYAACNGTPCLCYYSNSEFFISNSVEGVSLVTGQLDNCSFWHCAPEFLWYEDAVEQQEYIQKNGRDKFETSKYYSREYELKLLDKYCKESFKFRIKQILKYFRKIETYKQHIKYAQSEKERQEIRDYTSKKRTIIFGKRINYIIEKYCLTNKK